MVLYVIIFKYYFKIKNNSYEFRIIIALCIAFAITVFFTQISSNFTYIGIFILSGIILGVSFIGLLYYTLKTLIKQKTEISLRTRKIEGVLEVSEQTSEKVSNSATSLAASANEINASAEEISATTLEIVTKSQKLEGTLKEISNMANEIKIIANIITNISEQTNLLALNASIEAGRAGEQGKGFAVVAERVQKLAEESKNSVGQTSDIVESITKKILEASIDSVDITRGMEEISASTEEQTASMEEISATAAQLGQEAYVLKEAIAKEIVSKSARITSKEESQKKYK